MTYDHVSGIGYKGVGHDSGSTSRTFFAVPSNSSMMMINGTMGPDHSTASVVVSPLPISYSPDISSDDSDKRVVYNPWIARDAVIYLAILDPAVEYDVTITPSDDTPVDSVNGTSGPVKNRIGLHSVTFYSGLG